MGKPTVAHIVVVLNAEQDAEQWRQRHARGETLDETPYGYDSAEPHVRLSWTRSAIARMPLGPW